jgi:hypothetical protein
VIWKAVKVAARAITEREMVAPILAALANMAPPLAQRLDIIEDRLEKIEAKVSP